MFNSEWKEDDGYFESIIYLFTENSTPILKARAVRDIHGSYDAIVRDYQSGHMVASSFNKTNLIDAQKRAIELSRQIIQYQVMEDIK